MFTRLSRRIQRIVKRRAPLAPAPAIAGEQFIFVCGLHRSGTSVLHRVLQESAAVSGLTDTGVPEDEGQHLQTVFRPAYEHGGPGRFAFDPDARMTEASGRDLARERDTLLREWGAYYDLSRRYFIEKSPPNLLRARYLQALFPGARFVFIVRHPIAVALATEKWAKTTHLELVLHWHAAHLLMLRDLPHIARKMVVRYEDMTADFPHHLGQVCEFLGLEPFASDEAMSDQNGRYFKNWEASRHVDMELLAAMVQGEGSPMQRFGYLLEPPYCRPAREAAELLAPA